MQKYDTPYLSTLCFSTFELELIEMHRVFQLDIIERHCVFQQLSLKSLKSIMFFNI